MDLGIEGRVALVTGASSGIGEAVALSLAAQGVKLAVAARRAERLKDVARRAREAGAAQAHAFEVDLGDAGSIDRMQAAVRSQLGPVEILFANGGGQNCMRLNFSNASLERIREGIARLGEALRQLG